MNDKNTKGALWSAPSSPPKIRSSAFKKFPAPSIWMFWLTFAATVHRIFMKRKLSTTYKSSKLDGFLEINNRNHKWFCKNVRQFLRAVFFFRANGFNIKHERLACRGYIFYVGLALSLSLSKYCKYLHKSKWTKVAWTLKFWSLFLCMKRTCLDATTFWCGQFKHCAEVDSSTLKGRHKAVRKMEFRTQSRFLGCVCCVSTTTNIILFCSSIWYNYLSKYPLCQQLDARSIAPRSRLIPLKHQFYTEATTTLSAMALASEFWNSKKHLQTLLWSDNQIGLPNYKQI